jgi:beta-mannosidase
MNKYQDVAQLSGRFISEFGMGAYPHLSTTQRMVEPASQQHPGSPMMDFRNKATDHERRLLTYVAENFLLKSDLRSFTHLTQIVQERDDALRVQELEAHVGTAWAAQMWWGFGVADE